MGGMRTIAETGLTTLIWVRSRMTRREYNILANGELVGALRWPSLWSSLAMVETAGKRWTFQRFGLLRRKMCVRADGQSTDEAVFLSGWWGRGILELGAGRRYRWQRQGFWHPWWMFLDEQDIPVVQCRSQLALFRGGGRIEIAPSLLQHPDVPLLVLLGVYRVIERRRRAAARGAA